jgi:hypothetical protein
MLCSELGVLECLDQRVLKFVGLSQSEKWGFEVQSLRSVACK